MAKISTYPIISIPTIDDLLIGTDVNDLNNTKNFTIGEIGNLIGQDYVPYVGATGNVNLGSFNITGGGFIVGGGTASQFLKADGSLDSTLYTPQTRTLTINGTTYNLSANRSWDLNTIDSLTTTGTSGAATYIGKVLNIPVYQAQGSYITQLSGEATGSGPGNASVTLSNAAVISKVLTGLNVTGGTVVSTDSILQAFGKVQNQINGLTTGVTYQGVWNAATNVPFLQSSVGTKGYYYVVDVAGNTNLNGITDWQVGDWAIYNGTVWQKVDNTDAVVSVNGYVGAVVLTASDVGAVPTTRTLTINGVGYNLSADRAWTVGDVRTDGSYANPSWITSLGWSKITGTPTTLAGYGITDGALNTTTLTINGTTFDLTANRTWNVGTVTSVGTSGPLTGGTITGSGTIGITQAGASSDGYLSSTDWNTFNSKQGAISVNAPLTFVSGVIGITQSGASSDGYLSSTDWNTFNSKVSGSGTANTLAMWGSSNSLTNSPLSYAADAFNFQYNSATGGTLNFTNIGLTTYTYSIQMNNFGSPRSTIHSYTDGLVIQSIGGTQVSRMFANGNLILGTGVVDNGYKLEVTGNLYLSSIVNATVDTDRFIVSDGGLIKYRTGAQILSDIGAVSSVGLTMPPAFTVSNTPITSSGTIAVTAAGNATQYIRGDGTLADFPGGGGGGGGASVSYYLNGSVNQGTFGGNTYYEMSKTPILGAGTDFSVSADGYVAQFITDAGDPNLLEIPAGNWNFETYFSASSGGGTPTFYIELYKYDGTTFTLIASNSTSPELIAFGTTINPYFSALAVPQTSLLTTDRLAIRIYVNTSGRTITLHTEDNHLCQVITTFTTGLTALNGLTAQVQYFQTGTSGTDFNILSSVATHTFNLPTASSVNRGALSSADWTTFNSKQNALSLTTTGTSGVATLIGSTLNIPNYGSALSGYVPYTGATQGVNLGIYTLEAGNVYIQGPAPTSGSFLGFKQATTVVTGVAGATSISAVGTNQMNFSFSQPSGFREFKFNVSGITAGVPGGRVYTMPDADGTIALVGGSGVGTVTSVAALTLGTSGTDLSSTVADSTTTPVITLNVPTASATNRGVLSAADWTTFNNKQNALTNPVTGTGTTNRLAKFTGASTIGNSNISDGGITILNENPVAGQFAWQFNGNTTTGLSFGASVVAGTNSSDIAFRVLNAAASSNYFVVRGDGAATFSSSVTAGSFIRSGGTSSQYLMADGSVSTLTNPVTGTGTTNYLPKFTGTSTIGNSIVQEGGAGIFINGVDNFIPTNGGWFFNGSGNYASGIFASSSSNNLNLRSPQKILFQIGFSTEAMTLSSSGNLLVGTTTDNGARLQVSGGATVLTNYNTTNANGSANVYQQSGSTIGWIGNGSTSVIGGSTNDFGINSQSKLFLAVGGFERMSIASTGAATFSSSVTAQGAISTFGQLRLETSAFGSIVVGSRSSQIDFQIYNTGNVFRIFNGGLDALTIATGAGAATFSSSVTAGSFIRSGGTSSQYLMADGSVSTLTNPVTGTGTTNYLPKFTGTSTIGNSSIFDNGSFVGIRRTTNASAGWDLAIENGLTVAQGTTETQLFGYFGSAGVGTFSNHNFTIRTNNVDRATFTTTGNLGLGVTPSAWGAFKPSLQVGTASISQIANRAYFTANAFFNGTSWTYIDSDFATQYFQQNGTHIWQTAPSGTAGNAISFTQAMTLNASGNLGIGTANPAVKLDVIGEIRSTSTSGYGALVSVSALNLTILADTHTNGNLTFWTAGSEKSRVTSTGNLLVGTTTDNGARLQVSGTSTFSGQVTAATFLTLSEDGTYTGTYYTLGFSGKSNGANRIFGARDGSDGLYIASATSRDIYFRAGGGTTNNMTITSSGNVVIGNTVASNVGLTIFGSNAATIYQTSNTGTGAGNGFYVGHTGDISYVWNYNNFPLVLATNNTERMRITSGGNVGIGTSSPDSRLHVGLANNNQLRINYLSTGDNYYDAVTHYFRNGGGASNVMMLTNGGNVLIGTTTDNGARLQVNGSGGIRVNEDGSGTKVISIRSDFAGVDPAVNVATNNSLLLMTNNTERMRITSGGDVLINKQSLSGGSVGVEFQRNSTTRMTTDGDTVLLLNRLSSDGTIVDIRRSGTQVGTISVTTTATAYNTSSDYRLKTDLKDYNGLDLVSKIKTYDFAWKTDQSRSFGVIAHELQEVIEYAVTGKKDGEFTQGVDYSKLVPIMVKAIQELKQEIDTLKNT